MVATNQPTTAAVPAEPPALVELIADGTEAAITLTAAAKLPELSVDGRSMNLAKLYRAARRPIGGVLLDTAPIGGRLVTTRPAVRRWLLALNDKRADRSTPAASPTPRRQAAAARRVHAAAVADLTRAGFDLGGYVQ